MERAVSGLLMSLAHWSETPHTTAMSLRWLDMLGKRAGIDVGLTYV